MESLVCMFVMLFIGDKIHVDWAKMRRFESMQRFVGSLEHSKVVQAKEPSKVQTLSTTLLNTILKVK